MAAQPFRWMDAYGGAEGSVVRAFSMEDHDGNTILSVGYHSADITIKDKATGELLAMAPVLLEAVQVAYAELGRVQYQNIRNVQANDTPEMQALLDKLDGAIAAALGEAS